MGELGSVRGSHSRTYLHSLPRPARCCSGASLLLEPALERDRIMRAGESLSLQDLVLLLPRLVGGMIGTEVQYRNAYVACTAPLWIEKNGEAKQYLKL